MDIKEFRKQISIANQMDGGCVKTAVETVRMALGYEKGSGIRKGSIKSEEVIKNIGKWFPKHTILAHLSIEDKKFIKSDNVFYHSDNTNTNGDKRPCIWLFAYKGKGDGHMVIGHPVVYEGTTLISAFRILL